MSVKPPELLRYAVLFAGLTSLGFEAECDEWSAKMSAVTKAHSGIWRAWLDEVYRRATTTVVSNHEFMRRVMQRVYEMACQGYTPVQIMTCVSYWW